jgi:hypothetical protein
MTRRLICRDIMLEMHGDGIQGQGDCERAGELVGLISELELILCPYIEAFHLLDRHCY